MEAPRGRGRLSPFLKRFSRGVEIDLMPRFGAESKAARGRRKEGGSCKQLWQAFVAIRITTRQKMAGQLMIRMDE